MENMHYNREEFRQEMRDIGMVLNNANMLVPVGKLFLETIKTIAEYKKAENELETIKIKRELILLHFKSVDNFIRMAFKERAQVLVMANGYIMKGLKKNKPILVSTGLQIIKAVIISNPFETVRQNEAIITERAVILESNME